MGSLTVNTRTIRKLGGLLVLQLYLAARLHSLYGEEHKNTLDAVNALMERFRAFFDAIGRLTVRVESRYVFVNGVRIRVETGTRDAVTWVDQRFRESGLESLVFLPGLAQVEVRRFIPVLLQVHWREGGSPPPIARMLRDAFVLNVKVRMRRSREDEGERFRVEVPAWMLAAAIFGRLEATVGEFLERCRRREGLVLKSAKLLVQQAAELLGESPGPLLALISQRPPLADEDAYLRRHMTNVCILSLAIAVRLGLSREHQLAVGCAALVYDVGMARVPPEVRGMQGPLSAEEEAHVRRHALWSASAVLGGDDTTPQAFVAAVVAAHHHKGEGAPRRSNLYADIVAVADEYDALTTDRPWRDRLEADVAVGYLLKDASYDPDLVRIVANILGVYRVGALLELSTGEAAVVTALDADAAHGGLLLPRVKLLTAPDGRDLAGEPASLTERGADGVHTRTVRRVLRSRGDKIGLDDVLAAM